MPDTCFCPRCIDEFARETKTELPYGTTPELVELLLGDYKETWGQCRCDLFTDSGVIFVSGTIDRKIRAFDVDDGTQLWEYTLPFVGSAPPSIYEADGKQYIVIPSTGGRFFPDQPKGDAYVAFALEDM